MLRQLGFVSCMILFLQASAPADGQKLELRDENGRLVQPLGRTGVKATVLIFTRTDCPISNRYAPELKRLAGKYASPQVSFWLVYPDPATTLEMVREHRKQYQYSFPALLDPEHRLVRLSGARVTPEAAVFLPGPGTGQELLYRGRIDDWFVDFGKTRASPTHHDLEDVLNAVVNGQAVQPRTTTAVGCFIADLK